MAKGQYAKEQVAKKLAEVFGSDWIGEIDKKYYLWANDAGERVQICISMTCPKNQVGAVSTSFDGGIDFDAPAIAATTKFEPAEITEEEQENIRIMLQRLGL